MGTQVNNSPSTNDNNSINGLTIQLKKIADTLNNATHISKNMRSDVKVSVDEAANTIRNRILPQLGVLISNCSNFQAKENEYRKKIDDLENELKLCETEAPRLAKIEELVKQNSQMLSQINKHESNTYHNSYSKVASSSVAHNQYQPPRNSHASVLYIKNDKQNTTAAEALKMARVIVSSNPAGTAVVANKLLSNGKILVFSKNQESKEKLDQVINSSKDMVAEEPKRFDPLILIKGVPKDMLGDMEDRERASNLIPKLIKECNQDITNACENEESIAVVFFRKNRKDHLVNVGIKVSPRIRKVILETQDGKISFGFNLVHAEDVSPLKQCFHCLGFGHTKKNCPKKEEMPQCKHCPNKHVSKNCPAKNNTVICCNCQSRTNTSKNQPIDVNHSPMSLTCPIYKSMLNKAMNKTNYG